MPFVNLTFCMLCNLLLFQVFLEGAFFDLAFLHGPASVMHPFTILMVFIHPCLGSFSLRKQQVAQIETVK